MVRGCGNSCVKIILVAANIIVFLFGVCMLALGIWALVSVGCEDCRLQWLWKDQCKDVGTYSSGLSWAKDQAVIDNKSLGTFKASTTAKPDCNQLWSDNSGNIVAGAWGTIIVGVLLTLLGFLGCCGSWMENRLMLGGYSVLILIAAVLQVIFAVILLTQVSNDGELHKVVGEVVQNLTDKDLGNMQQQLQCCGDQYLNGDAKPKPRLGMPAYLCHKDNRSAGATPCVCVKTVAYPQMASHPSQTEQSTSGEIFKHGCPDILWTYIVAIVIATASVSLFEVAVDAVALCFACVLIVAIGKQRATV